MATYSNWREDLIEVIDTPTTEKKAEKKVKESKVNNKVVINPTFKEAVAEMGGQILEVAEVDDKKDVSGTSEDPQIKSKEKRAGMIKRQVLLKKLQAVRSGGGADITAGYEPEGEVLDEADPRLAIYQSGMTDASRVKGPVGKAVDKVKDKVKEVLGKKDKINHPLDRYRYQSGLDNYLKAKVKKEEVELDERLGGKGYKPYTSLTGKKISGDWEDSDRGAGNKAKKRAGGKVEKKSPTYRAHVLNKEDYETKKTGEVLAAFKKDPKVRKRFEKAAKKEEGPGSVKNRAADSMLQTAKDTAKRKGDTSKSDDRYAYEEVVLEKDLNAAERRALPNKDFVFPGKGEGPEGKQRGAYPINDKKHARAALAMAAAHASPEKEAKVKAAVKKKYPDIEVSEGIKGEDNETRKAAAAERRSGVKTRLSPSAGKANVAKMLWDIRNAKSNPKNESVALDANTKLQKKDDRKKKEKEYARLMDILAHQKDLKKRGLGEEAEKVDESKGHKYDDSFIEGETGSKVARRNLTRAMSSTRAGMGKPGEDSIKRRERHAADRGVKTKGTKAGHSGSAYPTKEKTLDDTYPHKKEARLKAKLAARKSGEKYVDHTHHSLKKKTVGEKLPKVNEGVLKFVKSIGRKKTAKKATMDATTDKLHDWRQKNSPEQKEREKYVSPFRPIVKEGDYHSGQGEKIQKRTKKWMDKKGQSGAPGLNAMNARTAEHKAKRGVKEESYEINPTAHKAAQKKTKMRNLARNNENPNEKAAAEKKAGGPKLVGEADDKAYKYVVGMLKKKYGNDAVLTKGQKPKPPTAAQQKKNAEIRAKRAKEDHRDPTEKASDGRYSDRYSNRGSD